MNDGLVWILFIWMLGTWCPEHKTLVIAFAFVGYVTKGLFGNIASRLIDYHITEPLSRYFHLPNAHVHVE